MRLLPLIVSLVVGLAVPAAGAADGTVHRAAGPDRVATAVALSRAAFPDGAPAVTIARADQYADALAGAPLAAALGGPLLLSAGDRLSAAAAEEIRRLGPVSGVLLGGTAALGERVEAEVRALVGDVRRVAGADRFGTAAAVASELEDDRAYVVLGTDWVDAVAVSGLAALERRPIALVRSDDVPPPTWQALRGRRVAIVVGGPAAISTAVEDELRSRGLTVERLAGATRYATSARTAALAIGAGADPTTTWVATGRDWPDGLAAGPAAAAAGQILVLVDGGRALGSPATWQVVAERADRVRLSGGRAAIGEHIALTAELVLETGQPPRGDVFDAEAAHGFAARLADEVGPRPAGTPADAAAADRLAAAFRGAGWTVAVEPFPLPQGGSSANVVAWLGDRRPSRHIVVGGHLDTVAGSPGANDNASGVGVLAALATELADEPTPVPVVLVSFGAEEYQPSSPRQHHIGSEAYAAAHASGVAAMISVDMVGRGNPTRIVWYLDDGLARRLHDVARQEGKESGYAVLERGDISDHGPFARRGVPAAFLWTGIEPGYHSPDDTSDRLVTTDIRRAGVLVLAWLRTL